MFTNDYTRAANGVITDLGRLGATVPPKVAETVKAGDDAKAALQALIAKGSGENLAAIAATRANGGKVNPDDTLDALLGAALAAQPEQTEIVQRDTGMAVVTAVVHNSDAIIEALRVPFDQAAEQITEARAALGDVALDDLAAITAQGGDAAAHWKAAKAAEATINTIRQTIQKMVRAGAYKATHDQREQALMVIDTDLNGYKQIGKPATAWDLSALGTLSLATASEYTARLDRVMTAWEFDAKNPATRIGPGAGQYPARVADPNPNTGATTTVAVIGGAL